METNSTPTKDISLTYTDFENSDIPARIVACIALTMAVGQIADMDLLYESVHVVMPGYKLDRNLFDKAFAICVEQGVISGVRNGCAYEVVTCNRRNPKTHQDIEKFVDNYIPVKERWPDGHHTKNPIGHPVA